MRFLAFILTLLTLPVLAVETVPFDKHDRFTVEFPDNWKKPAQPKPGAVIYRERDTGEASFSVSRLPLPKNAKADLHDTLKSFVDNFRKGGMEIPDDITGQDGLIDGKESVFAQVPAKLKQGDQAFGLTFFLVIIDCRDVVLVLQSTLSDAANNKVRDECRRIIGSLHEKDPADIRKKQENEEKPDADTGKPDKPKKAPDPKTDPRLR